MPEGKQGVTHDSKIYSSAFASIGITFRGTIAENCQRFKLIGKAYEALPREQDGHFYLESARHLAGPLRALLDPNVRTVIIIGATQVLKSVVGDIWIPFILEHALRNILVLFETDPKALLYCDARFMDTIKQHPVLSQWLGEVNRHDVSKTEIKVAGAKLLVGGLNDSNVSSLSWPVIWISEAWQHRNDGLLGKAIKRADRFPNDKKILIESQAGLDGEDLHREAKAAHQVPLTWACPRCGGRQTWEFSQLRPDDFTPLAGEPKPGTYAGMQFASEGDIAERARTAEWECYHCGTRIQDTKENRQAIMDSYEQDYQITTKDGLKVSPKSVCFYLPKESARDNSFEDSVKSYLTAKEAEKNGNRTPLENWFMSERAVFYTPRLTQKSIAIITSSSDLSAQIPNEAARVMGVDCQQGDVQFRTGKFWYVARAIDKDGKNLVQLARGYAENWEEWIAVQKRLKIPNDNVAIDGGNYLQEILDAAAANFELANRYAMVNGRWTKHPVPCRVMWKVFIGNGKVKSFAHPNKVYRSFSLPSKYHRSIEVSKGKFQMVEILCYNWSNLSVKDHLNSLMSGGPNLPKFIAIDRDQLPVEIQMKERGDLAYSKQMQNEYRTRVNGIDKWVEATSNANVHYRDCECECLAMLDIGGYLGLPAAADESAQVV